MCVCMCVCVCVYNTVQYSKRVSMCACCSTPIIIYKTHTHTHRRNKPQLIRFADLQKETASLITFSRSHVHVFALLHISFHINGFFYYCTLCSDAWHTGTNKCCVIFRLITLVSLTMNISWFLNFISLLCYSSSTVASGHPSVSFTH